MNYSRRIFVALALLAGSFMMYSCNDGEKAAKDTSAASTKPSSIDIYPVSPLYHSHDIFIPGLPTDIPIGYPGSMGICVSFYMYRVFRLL